MSTSSFTGKQKIVQHAGVPITVYDLAAAHGLEPWAIYQRWRRGDRDAQLVRPRSNLGGWQRRRKQAESAEVASPATLPPTEFFASPETSYAAIRNMLTGEHQ